MHILEWLHDICHARRVALDVILPMLWSVTIFQTGALRLELASPSPYFFFVFISLPFSGDHEAIQA
jgi:hypothetical protein